MKGFGRLAFLGLLIAAGCSSPPAPAAGRKDQAPFLAIVKGMTRDQVVERIGQPDPRSKRPDIWDYELGGPRDPVYRVIFDSDRVVHVKRFDGYAIVVPRGDEKTGLYTIERR